MDIAAARALGIDPDEMVISMPRAPGGAHGVPHSAELERVLALPRRNWWQGLGGRFGSADQVRELLSMHLRVPEPNDPEARLKLVQSAALQECHDMRGTVAPIIVGGGKTLLSLLLPVVMASATNGPPCVRPVLLTRANLVGKTVRERDRYALDWRVPELATSLETWRPGQLLIVSYDALSRVSGAELLERYRPDLIIADEAHRVRHRTAARTRRLARYIAEAGRGCVFAGMTGSLAKKTIRDYAHLLRWALREGSPVPRIPDRLAEWVAALDEGTNERISVGALARLCDPNDAEEQAALRTNPMLTVRKAFGRRLIQTPGVVAVEASYEITAKLRVRALHMRIDQAQADGLRKLRDDWETPGGEPFAMAADQWRHAREIGCGFYYKWKYPTPEEWMLARRDWCRFVRETLKSRRARDGAGNLLDTELQVANACAAGRLDREHYDAWRAIKKTFKPITEAVWISMAPLETAARWLADHPLGICWVEHVCVGRKLEEISGVPYYAEGGLDRRKRAIEDETGPIIASIAANGEGRNLQSHDANLVLSLPPSGDACEQLLGRTHRDGQKAGEVSAEIRISCREDVEGWAKVLTDAEYLQTTNSAPQKLLSADVDVGEPDPIPPGW